MSSIVLATVPSQFEETARADEELNSGLLGISFAGDVDSGRRARLKAHDAVGQEELLRNQ
jgi:hypothetical protein